MNHKLDCMVSEKEPELSIKDEQGRYHIQYLLPHSWEQCVQTYNERFDKRNMHLFPQLADCSEEVIKNENGKVEVKRVLSLNMAADFPSWFLFFLRQMSFQPMMRLEETCHIDYANRKMYQYSENVTFRNRVGIIADCVYEAHPQIPNYTVKTLKPRMEVLFNLGGLEKRITGLMESISLSKFREAFETEKRMMSQKQQ